MFYQWLNWQMDIQHDEDGFSYPSVFNGMTLNLALTPYYGYCVGCIDKDCKSCEWE